MFSRQPMAKDQAAHFPGTAGMLGVRSHVVSIAISLATVCGSWLVASSFWLPTLSNAAEPEENTLDPTQIRRVLTSPERVPEILARVKEGILVQLPRPEFEEKVRRALLPLESAKNPPRLVEARYRATLMSTSLVGTAQWKMMNPAPIPAVFSLQPFNLALVKANLRKAQFDTTEAILGDLDGKTLGLLLEQPGEQAARLNWSARGESGPSGLHFDLLIPPSPVATLELDLPTDMVVMPSGRDAHLLAGPFSTPNRARGTWRIEFGGQSKVDLIVRPRTDDVARHPPLILAQVQNTYDLRPEFVQADFEFKLEMPHHNPHQPLEFELDPILQPIEVSASNLEAWESPSPSKLVIRLKEPFLGGSILIRCLARLGPDHAWNCPGLRLLGAIPRGETIVFRIPVDMQLENWQSGDFRLTADDLLADGRQLLTLTATHPNEVGNPKRPSAQVNIPGPKYRVKQLAWWQIGPKGSTLTAQFHYAVATGQLFQLPLLLPDGWVVDKVELFPAELLRSWTVAEDQGHRTLVVDLQHALPSTFLTPLGATSNLITRLNVWLRPAPAAAGPLVNIGLPFPDIVPRGATFRDGLLGISVDPIFQARIKASEAATAPGEKGPWGRQSPDFYFAYQGKPLEGTLTLQPRQPRMTARCSSDVVVTPTHIAMAVHLALQPEARTSNSIILSFSAPVPALRNWKTKEGSIRIRHARRFWEAELAPPLAALGAPTILHGLNYLSTRPPSSQIWLLTFDRPLSEGVTLETTLDLAATLPPGRRIEDSGFLNTEQFWDVPIPAVVGADFMEGELTLQRAGTERLQVEATGLVHSSEESGAEGGFSWRKFRYGTNPARLRLRCQAVKGSAEPIADLVLADRVRLTTYLESSGKLVSYFNFRMVNWPQQTFPIRLPAGAQPMSAAVNGRWIPQLTWEETGEGAILLELPVMAGKTRQYYQIVYSMDGPRRSLWSRLKLPVPELPVRQVLEFRRTWCLPPGLAPLDEGGLRPLPGLSELAKAWNNRPLMSIPFQGMPLSLTENEEWADQQRRSMVEAGVRLRNRLQDSDSIPLGEALELLAFDFLKDRMELILDIRAFREAHLAPAATTHPVLDVRENSTPFPWEMWGLVFVPSRPGPLLTTRSHWESWNAAGQKNAGALASAINDAAIHGHDSSGRFQTVADWIWTEEDFPANRLLERTGSSLDRVIDSSWTEWEQLAGTAQNEELVVINRDFLVKMSYFFSVLLLLAAWQTRKSKTWIQWLLLLAWLTCGTLALIWLPAPLDGLAKWPALTGWAVALFIFVKWIASPSAVKVKLGSAAAIGSAVCCVLGSPGDAAAPVAVVVYVVPGPANAPAQQAVLAPPDVLEKLQDLADGILSSRRGPVPISARYQGTIGEDLADFNAEFQVHSFGDGPFTFTIPLSDITLRDALLDGAPANPTITPAIPGRSREGFSLVIRHRGTHSIRFHFTVPVQAAGDARKLQFRIPELAMSRLILEVPPASSAPYALAAKGAQRVTPTSGAASSAKKILRLEADLGQTSTLHVRWRQGEPKVGTVRIREAYFWNIQPFASSLFANLRYTISQGAVTNLILDLPEPLEVRNEPVVTMDRSDSTNESPPRLKDWHWSGTGKERRLVLELLRPWTGSLQVTLELIPRVPFGPNVELPLPAPQGVQPPAEKGTEHLLAYRIQGVDSKLVANLRVTGIEQDAFRNLWTSSGLTDPGPEIHAFSFQREPGGPPLLRLKLTPPTTTTTSVLNVTWQLRKNQADVTATAKLSSSFPELGLVEWEVPADLGILAIGGSHMRAWSRTGSRIQVWLNGLVAETTLQLTGWVSLPEVKAKSETSNPEEQKDKNGSPRSPVSFRLLPLRVGPTQSLTTFVRLEGDKDQAMEPANLRNLLPLPSSVVSNKELSFVTDQGDYSGEVFLRPAPSTSEAKVLTFLEAIDRQLSFRSDIDLSVPAGEKRRFTISLRNWQGEAHFEGHEVQVRPTSTLPHPEGEGREGGERRWSLDLQADSTGPVLVRLKGRAQLNLPKSSLPDVRVEGETRQQRWLALGSDLRGENPQGLLALTDSNSLLKWWPSQKDPLRQASSIWEIREPNWNLRLSPRAGVPVPAVQVLLADQQAAVLDGTHWEYQANYWLSHRPANDLTIRFPTNAKILEVAVDGTEISPLPLAAPRWWVPLAGSRAGQVLKFRWTYENAHSQLDRPILESPRLEGLPEFPATWTVHVPPGFVVERPQASAQEITAGAKFLRAAEAQLQLSLLLAKHDFGNDRPEFSSHLKAAQERFYRYCRLAEHWLTLTDSSDAVLQEIRQRNRKQATTQGFENIRQRAEEQARLDPLDLGGINDPQAFSVHGGLLTGQGTPTYWLVPTGAPAPQLHLTTRWQRKIEAATKASGLVVVILLVVVVVSCIPKARGLVKALGPEMMILLGCLGWWRATPDWSFVALIILGVFGRLLYLIRKWATIPPLARKDPESAIRRGDQSVRPSVAGSS